MNSFGRMFRISIFGESHGPAVGVLVDGCPAGLALAAADLEADLARRRSGRPGTTPRREPDIPEIQSGVFDGRTTGAPILIRFANEAADPAAYERLRATPRPSHADLPARMKYGGWNDPRGGGPFSGRLTVGLVAAGAVARKIIDPVRVSAKLVEAGGRADVEAAVERALAEKQTIGGIVACEVAGVPAGLGEPFFDSVESLLAHILFAIPAVKGVEFGAGFAIARMTGAAANDPIVGADGRTATNNAGGIGGGIANGNPIVFRVAVKPTPSLPTLQRTIDLRTGEPAEVLAAGRHDACIALRVPVVAEAAAAIVLADLLLLEQKRPRVLPGDAGR
ncbi:MAG: aroC [Candidatus Aminicenantes bacterium]|nr:aroC [Candidatus Aminicenantes bacterium]